MKIITPREVEFTDVEHRAWSLFHQLLDRGHSVIASALRVEEVFPNLDPAFYRWIKDEPII